VLLVAHKGLGSQTFVSFLPAGASGDKRLKGWQTAVEAAIRGRGSIKALPA